MTAESVSQIARAVLYEGYLLWPYRRSALKNQQRWTYGGVYPAAPSLRDYGERSLVVTECLVQGDEKMALVVQFNFLHLIKRSLERIDGAQRTSVAELMVGSDRYFAWDEALERSVVLPAYDLEQLLAGVVRFPFVIESGSNEDPLSTSSEVLGAELRSWHGLAGCVTVSARIVQSGLFRLTIAAENSMSVLDGISREEAQRYAFLSAHLVLSVSRGTFVSLTDPPDEYSTAAQQCSNQGLWPVLVGDAEARDTLLAAPIILPDFPLVAPESPGDLFDGGEIDQLLILNVLALSDEEKKEMRQTDPRAREILDRCASLTPAELARLHGSIRGLRPVLPDEITGGEGTNPTW